MEYSKLIDSASVAWRPSSFCEGVSIKDLGKSDRFYLQMVKFEAGVVFPFHKHFGPEFIYLLEGDAIQYGKPMKQGFVGISPAGSEESGFSSINGCVFLLFSQEETAI